MKRSDRLKYLRDQAATNRAIRFGECWESLGRPDVWLAHHIGRLVELHEQDRRDIASLKRRLKKLEKSAAKGAAIE